jgi:hypothetical protein
MVGENPIRDVTIFVSAYLVLSLPPFLFLNRELSTAVLNVAVLAGGGTILLVVVATLLLASEGVGRYTEFFFGPSDSFSVLVDFAFVFGATSWWLVPEVAVSIRRDVGLPIVITVIIISHLPMVLLLSLMTIVADTHKR